MRILFIAILIILILLVVCLLRGTLKNDMFHSTKDYPQIKMLEDGWKAVADEIPKFDKKTVTFKRSKQAWNNKKAEQLVEQLKDNKEWVKGWLDGVEWYQFPLMYHNKPIGHAEKMCPKTMHLLKSIPYVQIAGYAILTPKAKMPKHVDGTGKKFGSMACNLMLTGKKSYLHVKGTKDKRWHKKRHRPGTAIIFDATNEHYAENMDTDEIRVILYVDFKVES
jgi:beta-hydroxylase